MKKHTLTLLGGASQELRVPAAVLAEVLAELVEGARQAARFAVEGESVKKGPRPSWLENVGAFAVTGLKAGSAIVELEAPTLGESGAVLGGLDAGPLAEGGEVGKSGIDLFGSLLATAIQESRDGVAADKALLETCVRFVRAAGQAFEGLRIDGLPDGVSVAVRRDDLAKLERWRDEAPEPQAVRVSGVLDTISGSRRDVVLRLRNGERVNAKLDRHDPELLRGLFGKQVAVLGMGHFAASGRLLFIAAESLTEARPGDVVFEQLPQASAPLIRPPLSEFGGVRAVFGTWPGDETDEELLGALKAIRS